LELLGVTAADAVMIGDHEVDAAAAHALGMPCSLVEPAGGIGSTVDAILALPAA
ncbi:MAG: HAD hydrolase-like protein, partial [Solirubrobacteraceae bacterium]|nr:HAD hydrolase-like protein [Solirubrobacteraceae bacterium]